MEASDIRYNYRGALASAIGPADGLTEGEWQDLGRETAAIAVRLHAERARTPYRDVPVREDLSAASEIVRRADALHRADRFDDLVVLGIGGSALGLTALKTALCAPHWNLLSKSQRGGRPRLWVMDNVDPDEFAAMLDVVDVKRTLFNVISKSGETAETVAQFLLALDVLQKCVGEPEWRRNLVITTDRARGLLRPVVSALQPTDPAHPALASFVVPDGIGGRFSVMTPVGLFPAAMLGIDVRALLAGAAAMDARCRAADFAANPAAQAAAVQIGLYRKGKPLSVLMPYSAALKDVADWFRQLWAESLGKVYPGGRFVGPTPIKALGVTDQHSQVQLYREGPPDKVFTILSVDGFAKPVPLPEVPASLKGFDYFQGCTMAGLLKAEEQATAWALSAVSRRPVASISLARVTPEAVGGLLYMLMVQTSIAGEMLGINTYSQPGVEAGKQAAMALLGKEGEIPSPTSVGLPDDCKSYALLRRRIQEQTPAQA